MLFKVDNLIFKICKASTDNLTGTVSTFKHFLYFWYIIFKIFNRLFINTDTHVRTQIKFKIMMNKLE